MVTIIITGIVAAMTIPNIVADIRNNDMQVQLKNSYFTINQALMIATLRNGNVPYKCTYVDGGSAQVCNCPPSVPCDSNCYLWTGTDDNDPTGIWKSYLVENPINPTRIYDECNTLAAELKKNLNIIKTCSNGIADGCLGKYKTQAQMVAEEEAYADKTRKVQGQQYRGCGDQAESFETGHAYILSNGAAVFPLNSNKMYIDVNGKRPPNKWGYDVFLFSIHQAIGSGRLRLEPDGACVVKEPGGKTAKQIINQQ